MDKKDFCGHSHLPGNVFESMTDAVYLIDPHSSRIVDANRAAYESLGMTRNEVIDQSVLSLNKDVIGLDQWQAMRARDESKKNAVMNFLEAQQSEYGQGKKKRHKK